MPVRRLLAVAVLSSAAFAAHAQVPMAPMSYDAPQVDCAMPRGLDQRRTCEAAQQGVTMLRRYAHATRNIYAAHTPQYLATAQEAERRKAQQAAAPGDTQVAQAKP